MGATWGGGSESTCKDFARTVMIGSAFAALVIVAVVVSRRG